MGREFLISNEKCWIPACAGMTMHLGVIPAEAGIHYHCK